jgi:dihydropteroate synthase
MGVVNVTPDSFSDGGRFADPARAIAHGEALAAAGASILDVGGESTRPGASEVPAADEIGRVVPVVRGLARAGLKVSIDTTKAAVAEAALDAGAVLVNDISGFEFDAGMAALVARRGVPAVLMHIQGVPRTMQLNPRYRDPVAEICGHLRGAIARAGEAGVPADRLIVDPGIGFGKTLEHNLDILARLRELRTLGRRGRPPARPRRGGDGSGAAGRRRHLPARIIISAKRGEAGSGAAVGAIESGDRAARAPPERRMDAPEFPERT